MALIADDVKRNYKCQLGDDDLKADITIGGADGPFVPNINCYKWDHGIFFNVNHPALITSEVESFVDGVVSLSVAGLVYKYWIDDDGGLNQELVLLAKPPQNSITFNIDFHPSLQFDFQPPLFDEPANDIVSYNEDGTEGYDGEGNIVAKRPLDVVGSYAVFCNLTQDQLESYSLETLKALLLMKTGKFMHIYRPKATDANGNFVYVDVAIDTVAKTMTYTVDRTWLRDAAYPVSIR